eukprot:Platyproteum_vivax@DN10297_c0_g1_i1.p1
MVDITALDGANPIKDNTSLDIALLDDKAALSTSSQKVEEEGNQHAISAPVINQEGIGAAEALLLVQATTATPFTKTEERSPLIGKPGRYKNPILAIFATMSVARKTMQDVAKRSKEETRLMKKHWERISHEVSDHHNTAATATDKLGNITLYLTGALMLAPMCLKAIVPKADTYSNFIDPLDEWVKWGTLDYLSPKNFANDREKKKKKKKKKVLC